MNMMPFMRCPLSPPLSISPGGPSPCPPPKETKQNKYKIATFAPPPLPSLIHINPRFLVFFFWESGGGVWPGDFLLQYLMSRTRGKKTL